MDNNDIKSSINNMHHPVVLLDLSFQKKLLKLIFDDNYGEFALNILEMLKEEYFDGTQIKMLVKYTLEYFHKHSLVPGYDTLRDVVNTKLQENSIVKETVIELLETIKNQKFSDKAHVVDLSTSFCRKQALKSGLIKAVEKWEKGDYEVIANIIADSLKVGEVKSTGHNYVNDVKKRLIRKHRKPVTAMVGLDSRIGGGLAAGELGVILSPTGGGKSMMLVKFTATALEAGLNVVYYSCELGESVVANRVDSCLTQIPMKDIFEFADAVEEKMIHIKNKGGNLIVKEYPTGSATVQTLKNHIKSLEKSLGWVPHVIMVDYADILKSISEFSEKRFALTSIYEDLRGMSMELGIPIWTASQAGRGAINKDSFGLDAISESLGKAQTADIVVGVARTDTDKMEKKAKMIMLKNRNGEDGYSLKMHFDTTNINIYIEDDKFRSVGVNNLPGLERQIKAVENLAKNN